MFGCRKTFRWRKFVWNSERTLHIVWLSKSTSSRRNNCSKGQTPIYILMRMKKEQLRHLYYYSMHERLINWNNRSLYIFRERERDRKREQAYIGLSLQSRNLHDRVCCFGLSAERHLLLRTRFPDALFIQTGFALLYP